MKRGRLMMAVLAADVLLALACASGGSDTGDTGSSTPTTDDTAQGDSGTGDTANDDTGSSSGLTMLDDPCGGSGTPYAVAFSDPNEGWVGCGNGMGLWHTTDAGDTFTRGHPSTDLYVFQVAFEDNGDVLVCGHDYDVNDGTLLYRYSGGTWTDLLHYGNNSSDSSAVYMSNCGAVAAPGNGRIVVASASSGDITWSEDDGATWAKEERYWEDDNLDAGGYSFYYVLEMVSAGSEWYGAGSQITEPPVFFAPSDHSSADWYNRNAIVIDSGIEGEVWALATSDGGSTWFAGGRDQQSSSSASGFLYRSDDGGMTWTGGKSTLASLGNGELDIVEDIAFSEDGTYGIAVGQRYPTSKGGYVLYTTDGGSTWQVLDEDVPLLQSAAVVGTTFWIAGDAYLARGSFTDL